MNITVYLGANKGNDPIFENSIKELGNWIGVNHHTLIYGGSKTGLMGMLAESILASKGKVIGVEVQFFMDEELQFEGLTELIVTKNMSERKNKMIELGDVFIAFPGGTGTLEEISEIMSKISLKQITSPCIFYNLNGYYNDIKNFLNCMIDNGFSSKERQNGIYFANNLEDIKAIIEKF